MDNTKRAPVAVGGVGGSGTRFIAHILQHFGYYIGNDLNRAIDNLWFTLLFKRTEILSISEQEFSELCDIFLKRMTGQIIDNPKDQELVKNICYVNRKIIVKNLLKRFKRHFSDKSGSIAWQKRRAEILLLDKYKKSKKPRWGWKEPNTHIIIDRLKSNIPNLKYIHVIRNGLDMAFNNNQNQLQFWGHHFFGSKFELSPHYSLKYWCLANKKAIEFCNKDADNFLLFRYDDLFSNPEKVIIKLLVFLDIKIDDSKILDIVKLIHKSKSVNIHKNHDLSQFDTSDLKYVKKLGFEINKLR